ncbi:MAG: hypothetical protein QE277_10005 [Flectobacillus sp.]|nr:hypothetical protein [Flectobacillus sp.]
MYLLKKNTAILGCFLALLFFKANAQDYAKPVEKTIASESPLVRIKVKDGTVIRGRVVSNNTDFYVVMTENLGQIQIPAANVLSIEQILDKNYSKNKVIVSGFTPLLSTDYALGENAFNLQKGEVRYNNTMIALNKFDVGITKNISLSGTIVIAEGVALIGAKFTTEVVPMLRVGVSGYTGVKSSNNSSSSGHIVQGYATYGKPTSNITVGGIWISDDSPSLFQLSGLHRISNKVALSIDNFFFRTTTYTYAYNGPYSQIYTNNTINGLTAYGVKILGPRATIDLGMFRTFAEMGTTALPLGIPYIKVVTQIGGRKQQ